MTAKVIFDPRDLIGPPYTDCPFCCIKNSFGILSIHTSSFIKRCKSCFKDRCFYLPKISKRVLYLDQFVISNLMIVRNKGLDSYKRLNDKDFWEEFDVKLTDAIRKQRIVCPSSSFHEDESSLSKYYKKIEHELIHISSGIRFFSKRDILLQQIETDIENWVSNSQKEYDLKPENISNDDIHKWLERFIIHSNYDITDEWINEFREEKQKVSQNLTNLFKNWQKLDKFDLEDFYKFQLLEFGRSHFFAGLKHYQQLILLQSNPSNSDIDPSIILNFPFLMQIKDLIETKFTPNKSDQKVSEYLLSNRPIEIPYNKIFSILIASLAKKAYQGQKKIPDQGTKYDIELISCYLPYCNAMFLDKKMHSLLQENPVPKYIDYDTQLFSLNNKEEMINYLDMILSEISDEFQKYLKSVYNLT